MIIYQITDLRNNKIYIGQSKKINSNIELQKSSMWGHGKEINRKNVRKIGEEFFDRKALINCKNNEGDRYESLMIKKKSASCPLVGYNIAPGGRLGNGKHSDECKHRISDALKGKKFTEERKQNISESLKNRKLSKEHIENRSKALTGLKRKEKTIAKMKENHVGSTGKTWKLDHTRIYNKICNECGNEFIGKCANHKRCDDCKRKRKEEKKIRRVK
jgi:hypothetical protein